MLDDSTQPLADTVGQTGDVQRWCVTTWNVRGARRPDLRRIAIFARDTMPDVLALQEIRASQARALAARLGWRTCWTRKHYPFTPLLWWTAEGLAVLSRHRLHGVHAETLTPGVSTWTYRHRVLLAVNVERASSSEVRVLNLHLSPHAHPEARLCEARHAAKFARAHHHPAVLVTGDLNTDGERAVVDVLASIGVDDAWPLAGNPDPGFTHHARQPNRRLDYVLVPSGATGVTATVPEGGPAWSDLSDHLPLTVGFELRDR